MTTSVSLISAEGILKRRAGRPPEERGRPRFCACAVGLIQDRLRLAPGQICLELAPGMGKLTENLAGSGAEIWVLEPLSEMRQRFMRNFPAIRMVAGKVEAIDLPDQSVDSVVVGQAFHRFDGEGALSEIVRVLKPRGRLGLLWNVRDESNDWMLQVTKMINPFHPGSPEYRSGRWKEAFGRNGCLSPLEAYAFPNIQRGTIPIVLDRVRSIGYIARLPDAERDHLLENVQRLLSNHPMTSSGEFDIPYRTDVFISEKLG